MASSRAPELRQRTTSPDASSSLEDAPSYSGLNAQNYESSTLKDRALRRLPSLIWVVAAVLILAYTDLVYIVDHPNFNRTAARLGGLFYVSVFLTFLYINVWVPRQSGHKIDLKRWQQTAPRAIPFATFCGTVGSTCSIVALWSIYHVLSIPIFFTLFMAFIVILSFF
ncbi:hypothetical protein HMI54_009609 [Coelomomyces lativittatus]|nr:hypothetical protein HMI54_009609 [Coelomomyces lativittatus]KAJ1502468.1 hypothetical protein HMI56_002669 [Coelomomyces lativittatus]